MTWLKRHKLVTGIFIFILGFHLVWLINYMMFYQPADYSSDTHFKIKDKVTLSYSPPSYPSFTGNYAIANADDSTSLLIWPKNFFNQKMRYGVMLYDKEEDRGWMFYVNCRLEYDDNYNVFSADSEAYLLSLLKVRQDELKSLKCILEREFNLSL